MIAFMFPGQGSQFVGMGRVWAEESAVAAKYFERAAEALGRDLKEICFNGPEDTLTDTRNAQPAIYTVSCIAARLLFDAGLVPDYVAGHSIGEYAALYFARSFDFETGLKLVQARANAMAEAAEKNPGTMAAVIRLEPEQVAAGCAELASQSGPLSVAGYNSPEQTVISGSVQAIEKAIEYFKEKGAKRVLPLSVSGGFHSDLMKPAQDQFAQRVAETPLQKPSSLFVSNHDAKPVTEASTLVDHLPKQLTHPVRWTETLGFLKEQGCQAYVEAGPGNVLAGLLRKFDPDAPCATLTDVASIQETAERFHEYLCGQRKDYKDLD
jgi:[acyl-carrier-protein] S-malonyltransferase